MKWWEPAAMILVFWMLGFKPTFSLPSFTFIKRLFSSSLSAIRVNIHRVDKNTLRSLLTCWCMLSLFSRVWLFATLWTAAYQAPLSWDSPGKKTGVGCSCLPPRDLPNPGIRHTSLSPALVGKFFATNTTWEAQNDASVVLNWGSCYGRKPKDILEPCAA